MKALLTRTFLAVVSLFTSYCCFAQLVVTAAPNHTALAQRLVGDGVTISNVTFQGTMEMAGFFNNNSGTNINIDSGIVLTNGRISARAPRVGLVAPAAQNADNQMSLPGDADLQAIVSQVTNDAFILEFDFVPLGDSIKFNYVFSSEEYPEYACGGFNDAFAFFIEGPGITGKKNIALIPNTNFPVTIDNINDNINNIPGCGPFGQYYVDNGSNLTFSHDGHTTVLTAMEKVEPCEVYHLKLVIADVGDDAFDSGVFLQAKSLTSNAIGMDNITQTDPNGNSFLVEGCITGAFNISRPQSEPNPLVVSLSYGGTAINGVDYQALPTQVTIPANATFTTVQVIPIVDGIPEGIEELKIFALAGCAAGLPTDSTVIQIRDYDILDLTPDTTVICRNGSVQLVASAGYTVYQWNPDPTLSSTNIRNPVATPANPETTYICTATLGTCNARDSVFVQWKEINFISKQDVFCQGATNGNIKVSVTSNWIAPVEYSLDGVNWQATGDFLNLPAGNYQVKVRDANCLDSIPVNIAQAFPDLVIDNAVVLPASCTGGADGQISLTVSGGSNPYSYSLDGVTFQSSNTFSLAPGNYNVTIKDNNGCLLTQPAVITLDNTVTLDAGTNESICEGTSFQLNAVSNAVSYVWTPDATLTGANTASPVATPTGTTRYYVVATTGVCSQVDSVDIAVRPAPVADAGTDIAVCFGKTISLNGSGGVAFQWSPSTYMTTPSNIASPSLKATESITYSLMVTDATGCTSVTPDEIEIDVTPSVKIFAGNDTIAAINQPLQLNVVETGTAGVTSWNWSPPNNLNDPNISNPLAILIQDQVYMVTGTTPEGCEGKDEIRIKVYKGPDIYVPSAFTPNNDGRNDILKAIPVGMKEFRYFRIFNRWGQQVFATQDFSKGWDGRIKNIEQPTGTFVWIAEAVDYFGNTVRRQGTITIVR